ncbi:MAG TPA: 50S ribosomal protein L6 [Candidatus Omnitrophota bacterium]|nr:50S ribosomal protein L6 [Candidatus Omnitrophota bacterium]HPS36175.1 50S ribosomal protein L6 [Candidatus Omnitrophota bacterium]
MSRIGRKPVTIPEKVKVSVQGLTVQVQGPKGSLTMSVHPRIKVAVEGSEVKVSRPTDIRTDRALHGLTRSLIQNMIHGVTTGYGKDLEIVGVGAKAAVKGNVLSMSLGFTHPIDYAFGKDVEIKCPKPTQISITGLDKQRVGQVAAEIRAFAKPEPYKGKGIRYVGEYVRRKQGKAVS